MRRLALLCALSIAIGVLPAHAGGWLDPMLIKHMRTVGASGVVRAYVTLNAQVDLRREVAVAERTGRGLAGRHYAVITSLQDLAAESQTDLLAALDEGVARGEVRDYRSFWIVNSVSVAATPAFLTKLAARDDVRSVYYDAPIELIAPAIEGPTDFGTSIAGIENGITVSRAPELWAMGIDGTGALACDQDTGADGNHPAFKSRWRGLDPGVTPAEAWFDPVYGETFPTDSGSHGTHTLGTILGDDGAGNQIGMAPGAKWIGAKTIDVPGGDIFTDAVAAFQWAADPDGDPGTIDDVPDVVSNSWGLPAGYYGNCRADFNAGIDAAEAAGVTVVFAAGNEGPGAETLRSPGDRITSVLNSFSVGALNQDGTTAAYFTSIGPSACDHATLKPEVAAVGVDVRSAAPGGGYQLMSGTSMATPHVAGAVVLLRSAFPEATPEEIKLALYMSAVDLGPVGEDNTFGRGRIDVVNAYLFLLSYLINPNGKVEIDDAYSCADEIRIRVADSDLAGPTITVTITSATEPTPESVVLANTGTTGEYEGTIATAGGAPVHDGVLQVAHGAAIQVLYIDANDGEGGTNVPKTDHAFADCLAPAFAGATAANPGDGKVTVTWDPATDGLPVTYLVYRATTHGGQDFNAPIGTATASPYVDSVPNGITYYYVVRAQDAVGNRDANTVERAAKPTGPNLIWRESWGTGGGWDHPWTITDGGTGAGTWTDTNPGSRSPQNVTGTFMIVDSDYYGTSNMDETLTSEVVSVAGFERVFLKFAQDFYHFQAESGDVEASFDGGAWTLLAHYQNADARTVTTLDLASHEPFASVQVRFHYYNAYYEWWWALDDLEFWGWPAGANVTCYRDADGDGFGDPAVSDLFEDECPAGWSPQPMDCDDGDPAVHPGAPDVICDGVDDNCDGAADDGYVPFSCGVGECVAASTCVGGVEDCVPGTPVTEICDDGRDNDCDGFVDTADPDCIVCATAIFMYSYSKLQVSFLDQSVPGSAPLSGWAWAFGDGQTSIVRNPVHNYASAGTYQVCLTVTDGNACTDQSCQSITVKSGGLCGITENGGRDGLSVLPLLALVIGLAMRRRRR